MTPKRLLTWNNGLGVMLSNVFTSTLCDLICCRRKNLENLANFAVWRWFAGFRVVAPGPLQPLLSPPPPVVKGGRRFGAAVRVVLVFRRTPATPAQSRVAQAGFFCHVRHVLGQGGRCYGTHGCDVDLVCCYRERTAVAAAAEIATRNRDRIYREDKTRFFR